MSFYHAQEKRGNLQLLCKRHHEEKTKKELQNCPF
jgi:hypothetical protein